MKKILILLALMLPLGASAQLRVMSYNIRFGTASDGTNSWQYRCGAVLAMVEDQHPDVMGLQEALSSQVRFLSEYTTGYAWIGVGRDDGRKAGEYTAIFFNKRRIKVAKWGTFWLSETPDKPTKGWDAACYRTATWAILKDKKAKRKFLVVNTHLDHIGQQARRESTALILDRIAAINKKDLPVILMGDMNAISSDPALAPIEEALSNTRAVAVQSDRSGTFHDWGRDKHPQAIDHIYCKGFGSCTLFEVIRKPYAERNFVSDHYPIQATLVF